MKLECCRDQTPTSPLRSSCRQSCSYSSPQITGATPVLEPREEKREPGRSTAPGRRERASSPDRSPRHLPAARGTCSSAPGFRVASCAPAGAARAAAGRRVRCTPAATPRSYSCTQRAAAAPTCCPALPWPANPGTGGPDEGRHSEARSEPAARSRPLEEASTATCGSDSGKPVPQSLELATNRPKDQPPAGQQPRTSEFPRTRHSSIPQSRE